MARDYGPKREAPPYSRGVWSGGQNAKSRHNKRTKVWDKTGGYCFHCGMELTFGGVDGFHMDHAVPKSKGGSNALDNLNPSCQTCNVSRNNKEGWTVAKRPRKGKTMADYLKVLEEAMRR